jgi:hypothetical protein
VLQLIALFYGLITDEDSAMDVDDASHMETTSTNVPTIRKCEVLCLFPTLEAALTHLATAPSGKSPRPGLYVDTEIRDMTGDSTGMYFALRSCTSCDHVMGRL